MKFYKGGRKLEMSIEFDDIGGEIKKGLSNHKKDASRKVGQSVEENLRRNLQEDKNWAEVLRKNIEVEESEDQVYISVDHPAAPLHEYGGSIDQLQRVEARRLAYDWYRHDLEEVRKTVPDEYYEGDGSFMIPPKMYLRNAIRKAKHDL